jgi:broad specificity phosphatase PhoE
MGLERIILVRHAERQDTVDDTWTWTAAEPYNPPLAGSSARGQAVRCGREVREHVLPGSKVVLHSSPYLRCVETAACIASALGTASCGEHENGVGNSTDNWVLRMDAVFSEWMTSDYFSDISPPPDDDSRSVRDTAIRWLFAEQQRVLATSALKPDLSWGLHELGHSGVYGEQWATMHTRFQNGLRNLINYYDKSVSGPTTAVVVTHGAGCNSLLGFLTNQPLLSKVGLARCVVAERRGSSWEIVFNSNDDHLVVPVLSNSNSTSCSSVSDQLSAPAAEDSPASVPSWTESPEQFYFSASVGPTNGSIRHQNVEDPPLTLSFGGAVSDVASGASSKCASQAPSRVTTPHQHV